MDEPCPPISQIFHMPEMHFHRSLHLLNLHFLLGLGLGITSSGDASFLPSNVPLLCAPSAYCVLPS